MEKIMKKSNSRASLKKGITKDFQAMLQYTGTVVQRDPENSSSRRRKSITKMDIQEEMRKSVSPSPANQNRKTLKMAGVSLYSSNDEEDQWNQQRIKEEMKKLSDFEIDPKDIEELVSRVTESNKSPKLEILNFALQRIQQLEGRKSRKISNHEKDRIIM
jgi:hypothetical protein